MNESKPITLERILDRDVLLEAYKRVRANKGSSGIDGMKTEELLDYIRNLLVTFDVSQLPIGWLKDSALANIASILVTLEVSLMFTYSRFLKP